MIFEECVECTRKAGMDMPFTIACLLVGHHRLILQEEEE